MVNPVASRSLPSTGVLHALGTLSILEMASLGGLLLNLVTIHLRPVTAILGPTHGALYLCVGVIALLARGVLLRTRLMALVPVLGAVLTLVNIRTERQRIAASSS